MQTTLILQFDDTTKFQQILTLVKQLKVPFQFGETAPNTEGSVWDEEIHPIIQERLIKKYVETGQWATMNDDERQDASLLEKMLHDREQPDYEVYSETDTKYFLANLKRELHEVSRH